MIAGEVRMQTKSHRSGFARRFDIGNRQERFSLQRSVFDDSNATGTFSKQHSPVGGEDDRPGDFDARDYGFDSKASLAIVRRTGLNRALSARSVTARKHAHCQRGERIMD